MDYKTSFAKRLRIKLEFASVSDVEKITSLSNHNGRSWFKEYLIVTHSIIRSSVPLMQAAYERCTCITEDRKLLKPLSEYYKKHIKEEENHDEWLLDDLESIGVPREESLLRKPLQEVAELVGSQYYWIHFWHPVCLLGYISFLEGNPPKKQVIDHLQKISGYPDTAFKTILKHSNLDPTHRDELNKLLEVLPLTRNQEEWITTNALYSARKLIEVRNHRVNDEI
jgi:hypothetical protein